MALKLNTSYLSGFLGDEELKGIAVQTEAAAKVLHDKNGLGSDFLGWVGLPVDYDREEYARIKAAAEKIDQLCGRGATIIEAKGAFRGDPREIVMCACSTKEMLTVERAVKLVDPNAFTVILESNEVLGEGFKSFRVAEKQE